MLGNSEKSKIEAQLDKLLNSIKKDSEHAIQGGAKASEVIGRVTKLTINKVSPESKMLLSSAYNMMMERTLSDPYFSDPQHKASFYEKDILKLINAKFDLSVPSEIAYQEEPATMKNMIASGAVVATGGIVSITLSSWLPVCIAAVLAGIMVYVLKSNRSTAQSNNDVGKLIDEYLQNVKQSFMLWLDAVETFYDEQVEELKTRG